MKALWVAVNAQTGWVFLVGVILVTVWNGYRWRQDRALALRLRGKRPESVSLRAWPEVSVLVAAWNEAHIIREHIESFLRLRYPNKELILCAGGDDGSYRIACQYTGQEVVVLEQQAGEGKQRALRRGFGKTSGDIIFLTDADCLLDDKAFVQTLTPVIQGKEKIATGSRRPLDQQLGNPFVAYQWYYHAYCAARHPQHVQGLEGRNTAIRREVLRQVGGFRADVPIGTDHYLAHRLLEHGHRIRYVPRSEIRTQHAATYGEYWRQQSRWQRNIILHGARFGTWASVWGCVQRELIGLFMLGAPIVACGGQRLVLSVWAVLVVYGFLSRLRYVRWAELGNGLRLDLSRRYGRLLVHMFVDFVAWVVGPVDLLLPRRRWKW